MNSTQQQHEQTKQLVRENKERIPGPAFVIGVVTGLPIVSATAVVLGTAADPTVASIASLAVFSEIALGAPLLSFSASIHWALAAAKYRRPGFGSEGDHPREQTIRFTLSSIPTLLACGILLLPPYSSLLALSGAFSVLHVADYFAWSRGFAPSWYIRFRTPYNVALVLSFLVTWLVVNLKKQQHNNGEETRNIKL